MNSKRYLIAALGAGVFIFFYGWIVNTVVLKAYWAANITPEMMRPMGEVIMRAIVVACLLQGLALEYLFFKRYEEKGLMEGS